MKWIEIPVPLSGKTAVPAAEWLWHLIGGQRREIHRLAAADAENTPVQVLLTLRYAEIVAGLVSDDGLRKRDMFLADLYSVRIFNSWMDATGRDVTTWMKPGRTKTFVRFKSEDARAFLAWQNEGATSNADDGRRANHAAAAVESLRLCGAFDNALWRVVDRTVFDSKAKMLRSQIVS